MEWYHPHLLWIFSPQPNLEFLAGKAEVCSYSDSIQISCHRLFHWIRPCSSSLCRVCEGSTLPHTVLLSLCHPCTVQKTVQRPNSPQPACCEVAEVWLELLLQSPVEKSRGGRTATHTVFSWWRHIAAATPCQSSASVLTGPVLFS